MATLVYTMLCSLDGYVADESENFDWAEPSDEVHRFVNDLERSTGVQLIGRRMYQLMTYWETADRQPGQSEVSVDYAHAWQAADKVVYSRTLDSPSTARTRLEREFDPEAVRRMKEPDGPDISIAGPDLAGQAFRAGLVDEVRIFVVPAIVGGGHRALPNDVRLDLDLLEERRFGNGTVYLRYSVRP